MPQASFLNSETGWADFAGWVQRQADRLGGRCLGLVVEATGGLSRRWAEALAPHIATPVSIVSRS